MNRYEALFERLGSEGAFVPFFMLGDPDLETSLDIIRTAIRHGADALELGVPFSDPVADGPTIAAAHLRGLNAGGTIEVCLSLIRRIREEFPDIPIGMLVYSNVAFSRGIDAFYQEFSDAGADSILMPDLPVRESLPFVRAAHAAHIAPIFIAPAQASAATLAEVAQLSQGYIYAISRDGVTGTERTAQMTGLKEVVENIARFNGPPVLLGFGISKPEHVTNALAAGARGAITGSALSSIIATYQGDQSREDLLAQLGSYIAKMKAATI
ncbi:tryptophan synthase subunit alpha [Corynebacterium sp. ES2794-CONJ1]|uniref:tryptophan synthase subunit alpha n=1 Tax=unclassified Corynebacterium TaxID=2624378 RepID=UPI002166DE80|nr:MULTISPECIES: tryptophan synthase subunit alpha [unclassified Corynebacterium]MCS4490477.1 tryptophan synthase subunit alpha [Corynebacterium sp. ES2775-CONJ]MCU9519776.1 tryptophan synthase subunit alpha [Corynebacterium sp. ES2794-CONJ1]